MQVNTLEDILNMLGSQKPFKDKPLRYDDGMQTYLTKSGGKAYDKLTSILYGVGKLCNVDMNNIVEQLDSIADGTEY
jgi:hypothetical protein